LFFQETSDLDETFAKAKLNSYALPSKPPQSIEIKVKEKETVSLKCPVDAEPVNIQNDVDDELSDTIADDFESHEEMPISKRSLNSNIGNSSTQMSPLLIVQWFKESSRISQFAHSGRYRSDGALLRIINVRPIDAGKYKCKIINGFGTVTHTINLIVECEI
jgi:hypothetical protein